MNRLADDSHEMPTFFFPLKNKLKKKDRMSSDTILLSALMVNNIPWVCIYNLFSYPQFKNLLPF